jgi:DNA-binding transcriptional LysR family regulator
VSPCAIARSSGCYVRTRVIITDGFDAGVRLAEAVPQDMIAMPLGPHARHVVVGEPSYFANRSRPTVPADLMDHECIRARYSSGALYRWELERHGEAMRIDVPGSLTLDEPEMIAQASRAGIGLAYVGEWMVADIASGRLVVVLSEWTPSYPGYCLYYPGRRHMAASLRAFVDLAKDIVFRSPRRPLDGHRTGGPIAARAQQLASLTR